MYRINLHHLAPDLSAAGVEYADAQIDEVPPEKVRELLDALAALAPQVEYPAASELRISDGEALFIVQVKEGVVRLTSWAAPNGGGEFTAAQIMATITGTEVSEGERAAPVAASRSPGLRSALVGLMAGVILGANGVTAWKLLRPPPDDLPAYRLLEPDPARRLLAKVAGSYETGPAEGDRSLNISVDGAVHWVTYGKQRAIAEESALMAQAAQADGRLALLTSDRALIEIAGPLRVVFYDDVYERKAR